MPKKYRFATSHKEWEVVQEDGDIYMEISTNVSNDDSEYEGDEGEKLVPGKVIDKNEAGTLRKLYKKNESTGELKESSLGVVSTNKSHNPYIKSRFCLDRPYINKGVVEQAGLKVVYAAHENEGGQDETSRYVVKLDNYTPGLLSDSSFLTPKTEKTESSVAQAPVIAPKK